MSIFYLHYVMLYMPNVSEYLRKTKNKLERAKISAFFIFIKVTRKLAILNYVM